jgi:hypothetical protein
MRSEVEPAGMSLIGAGSISEIPVQKEFRWRVKAQGSLPSEDAAVVLIFGLVASGQIKLRRIDGSWNIPTVFSQHETVAA